MRRIEPAALDDHTAGPATDLRRKRVREVAETIVDGAAWAMPEDRALLIAMFREGMSASEVAAMRGESARIVRARVRRLVDRILSPRFAFVLLHRDRWAPPMRRVATVCILQGRSMRDAAKHLRVSLHAVRQQRERIEALFEAQAHRASA